MWLEGKRKYITIFLAWLLLVVSFHGNFFQVGLNKDWFDGFQADSRVIVENAAVCKGLHKYDGPVYQKGTDKVALSFFNANMAKEQFCHDKAMVPYDSQYGAQARVVAAFAPQEKSDIDRYLRKVELLLSMLSAAVVMMIIVAVYRLVGLVPTSVMYTLAAVSPWIVGYARNLYWFEWMMLLPFAFALLAYPWFKGRGLSRVFYGIEAVLLYVKLLNGYEHVTVVAVSVLVPVVMYEAIKSTAPLWKYWKQAMIVAGISVIALGGAIATHLGTLSQHYGSWDEATARLRERSSERSVAGLQRMQPYVILGTQVTLPDVYAFIDRFTDLEFLKDGNGSPVKYAAISAINYLLLPAVTLPISIAGVFGVVLQSVAAFMVYGFLAIRRIKHSKQYKKYYRSLLYGFWVSVLAWMTWIVLMPGHVYPHAHLNAIIFYLPMLFICYMAIGCVVAEMIKHRKGKSGARK